MFWRPGASAFHLIFQSSEMGAIRRYLKRKKWHTRHTTDRHRDSETELAQLALSVKQKFMILKEGKVGAISQMVVDGCCP